MVTQPGSRTDLAISQAFPHSATSVWSAMLSPEVLDESIGEVELERVEGGVRATIATFPIPAVGFSGRMHCDFTQVNSGELLGYRFRVADNDVELDVVWRLTPEIGGTRVDVVHDGFDLSKPGQRSLRSILYMSIGTFLARLGECLAESA